MRRPQVLNKGLHFSAQKNAESSLNTNNRNENTVSNRPIMVEYNKTKG